MNSLRWGVIGTGKIGRTKVVPAMQRARYCDVVAIASRDADTARRTADALGIRQAFGSYDALLADPDIDAVYIPLPNHLHVPWSTRALEAGKHVLCEKPIALDGDEAEQLADAAAAHPRLKIMEAFMYRHHPQWIEAKRLVDDGQIGELRTIDSIFAYTNVNPANIRNRSDMGGGGLMDIGCYNVSLSRWIFGAEPRRVMGVAEFDPVFRTDTLTSGILEFEGGTSLFTCSTKLVPCQRVQIFGTEGRIELEIPFNAPIDSPHRLWLQRGTTTTETVVGPHDQYAIQADLFSRAVLDDTPVPTPLADAVANMRVIDRIFQSAASGAWT